MHSLTQSLTSSYPNNDPYWNYVSAYLRGNEDKDALGRFRDNTKKRYWSTGGQITLDTSTYKYGGGSLQFPGNNPASEIGTSAASDLHLTSQNFTMELWFNSWLWPGGTWYPGLIAQRASSTSQHAFTWFLGTPTQGGLGMNFSYTTNGSTNQGTGYVAYSFSLNTWHHVAVSRSGTNLYLYADGTRIGSPHNIGTSTIYSSGQLVKLGCIDGGIGSAFSNSYFFGWMSDIRITVGVDRYSGNNFTPPLNSFPDK